MRFRPINGQQVYVHFVDSSFVPVTFAGWCVRTRPFTFTLTDGYSKRKFPLFSPLLLQMSLSARFIEDMLLILKI